MTRMRPCKSEPVISDALPTDSRQLMMESTQMSNRCSVVFPDLHTPVIPQYHQEEAEFHVNHHQHHHFYSPSSNLVDLNKFDEHRVSRHSWASSSQSLESSDSWNQVYYHEDEEAEEEDSDFLSDMLTIESLRLMFNTCLSCGVNWQDNHVSLDCKECDGYSMSRPCPECEGTCGAVWSRNVDLSHSRLRACWEGQCRSTCGQQVHSAKLTASSPVAVDKTSSVASLPLVPPIVN